jgi:hypothetical protein
VIKMNEFCMAEVANCTALRVYVRGEVVRQERMLRRASQVTENGIEGAGDFHSEGLRILNRGTIHSGWDVQVLLLPPAWFDEDIFFSLYMTSRTSATAMYAVEYCEVALIPREEVLSILDRFPYIQELYVRQMQRQRWHTWCTLQRAQGRMNTLLTSLDHGHSYNTFVEDISADGRRFTFDELQDPVTPTLGRAPPPPNGVPAGYIRSKKLNGWDSLKKNSPNDVKTDIEDDPASGAGGAHDEEPEAAQAAVPAIVVDSDRDSDWSSFASSGGDNCSRSL